MVNVEAYVFCSKAYHNDIQGTKFNSVYSFYTAGPRLLIVP